ncbi:type VI secretion system membrane subunit TssM [uncultured Tateyamaria sp.]|uniref:type VI secretion system membrane subunit TssM n=1 Tax=uncultured Tateyamaria sp. TaxID=455651 RepID=UPI002628FA62|nr:type VI secretion system membrane subunit TssM [uncultured Tateyamaria sp.]
MKILKKLFGFLFSRFLWTLFGIALLCGLIWSLGGIVKIGSVAPLESAVARIVTIGLILIVWLVSMLLRQMRAARANRVFVTDLAAPPEPEEGAPGDANIAEIEGKFKGVLDQMKRSKLGGRKFLRDMPWYVIIGPPGTGKTTALRQSGLHFPIDLSDDLKGIGGTRNCDWFFTEDVVLIDTAGRYVEQQSDSQIDAAEWFGFLKMLKKHRGRRALNGIVLTLSVNDLLEGDDSIREHGRIIRARLAELKDELGVDLPVYLLLTKTDLIPGFEAFFGDLTTREREQVWGSTFNVEARLDPEIVDREMKALLTRLESKSTARIAEDLPIEERAQVFRFPTQMDTLTRPLKLLLDVAFGESRYEEAARLRGFYFTSATQEGSPLDAMVAGMAQNFGMPATQAAPRRHGDKRSFFLRDLMTDLIFPEAGLGTFDAKSVARHRWLWRGTLGAASFATLIAIGLFVTSYVQQSRAIGAYEDNLKALGPRLSNIASRQAPTDPLDLNLALDAVSEVARANTVRTAGLLSSIGPSAQEDRELAQNIAYERALDHILTPRMVALLEATMWRQIRDPEYLLGALKTYQMMTGLAPFDADFVTTWWQEELPQYAPLDPFAGPEAAQHQLAAIAIMQTQTERPDPDPQLVNQALEIVCTIPISKRAYATLMNDPDVAGLPPWIPAEHMGPNGQQVFTRLSEKTLRVGIPGAFTYDGFHTVVAPRVGAVAVQAALDRSVFAGGCPESAGASERSIEADVTKLYFDDYIEAWDGLLRDIRVSPITDLERARTNLKDLAGSDSALQRFLTAVVLETDLTDPRDDGQVIDVTSGSGLLALARKRISGVARLTDDARLAASGIGTDAALAEVLEGRPVADHFAPLKATVKEVDGNPPLVGDTIAALQALSNEIQVIAASPQPEQALARSGGLSVLTGAVANEARILPDPVDDWIAGIAADATAVSRDGIVAQLNASWRADVLPFCQKATRGRYPFDRSSGIDVNILDFARLFGAGGLIDGFIENELSDFVNTSNRPWRWQADFGLSDEALAPFENARAIRDALFPGGAGPLIGFVLVPQDLSANAARVSLNVDGQLLTYAHAAAAAQPLTWPGPNGSNMVTLSFAPLDGGVEVVQTQTGAWAILRLISESGLSPSSLPEVFNLNLSRGGYTASFQLQANSVENPFDLKVFSGFKCPESF